MASAAPAPVVQTIDAKIVNFDLIDRSATNPRKRFHRLEELAANIKAQGMRVPLLVRPRPGGRFELIDGERRHRAAEIAELTRVPVIVEDLSDHDAREIQLITLIQRDDAHPLEEADAYRDLMAFDKAYTVEAIAAKVGKDPSYIYKRLKLTELIPAARAAYEADEITAGHAMELARLTPERQADGLGECFHQLFGEEPGQREPAPLSKLKAWIQKHDKVDVASPDMQHYFPEVEDQISKEVEPEKLLQLSRSHTPGADLGDKKHGILGTGRWTANVGGKNRCPNVERGIVVHGGPMEILDVCATKGCPKHFPVAPKREAQSAESREQFEKAREEQEAKARKEQEARAAWEALKPVAIRAFADHLKGVKLDAAQIKGCLANPGQVIDLIGALTPAKALQAIVLDTILSDVWSRERFLQAVKPFRFNLGKVEHVMKAKPAAAAKKKTGKGRR
jgi:ParB/RepB/Spo0J family partition protein